MKKTTAKKPTRKPTKKKTPYGGKLVPAYEFDNWRAFLDTYDAWHHNRWFLISLLEGWFRVEGCVVVPLNERFTTHSLAAYCPCPSPAPMLTGWGEAVEVYCAFCRADLTETFELTARTPR